MLGRARRSLLVFAARSSPFPAATLVPSRSAAGAAAARDDVSFKVPWRPGDLSFWAQPGLLGRGQRAGPRGLYSWTARARTSSPRCAVAPATPRGRLGGADQFWVVNDRSAPAGSGLALCRFKDGQVVGSWSTRVDAADPFRQMTSATCDGPDDCWFRGVGPRTRWRTDRAFHLHCNRADLDHHGRRAAASPTCTPIKGRSTRGRWSGALQTRADRRPGRTGAGAEVIRRINGHSFAADPFLPAPLEAVPADGRELLALDSDARHQPLGGVVAPPPRGPRPRGRRGREAAAGGAPRRRVLAEELTTGASAHRPASAAVSRDTGGRRRGGDRGAVRRRTQHQRQATVALIRPTVRTTLTACRRRGGSGRRRCASPARREDARSSPRAAGYFHYSDGSAAAARRRPHLPRARSTSAPTRRPKAVRPRRFPVDDCSSSRRRRWPGRTRNARTTACRRCCAGAAPPSQPAADRQLHLTRGARVALMAKSDGRTVARTPPGSGPGRRRSASTSAATATRRRWPSSQGGEGGGRVQQSPPPAVGDDDLRRGLFLLHA